MDNPLSMEAPPDDPQARFDELLLGVRQGSDEATKEFLSTFGPHMVRVIRRALGEKLRSKFDTVDFLQAVWASFFAHLEDLDRLDDPEKLMKFLCAMAQNKVVTEYRSQYQTVRRSAHRIRSLDGSAVLEARSLMGRDPTPSQLAITEDLWQTLLEGQPESYRQLLELRRAGLNRAEIAHRLGLDVRTVGRVLQSLCPENAA